MKFSNLLVQWYLQNKRDLPWRNTTDPYRIWLSEIILQQTRVAQGLPYYLRFIDAFPTVFDLAQASEESVLKLWQGLGYYSRARNLHATAQQVAFDRDGVFPKSYVELLELKGIGVYTASAIASFSHEEKVAVVDGNVFRVLSRYFAVETDIGSSGAKKEFTELATALLPEKHSSVFNQAIMEFGALQCVPKSPNCDICVFNDSCLALKKNWVSKLPIKEKRTKVRSRYFNYLVFKDATQKLLLQKRTDKGIWHNLYEFPLLETDENMTEEQVLLQIQNQTFVSNPIRAIGMHHGEPILHKLSHQHLHIRFWEVVVEGDLENGISCESAQKMPFPIVIYNFISTL
jgi:A/G-specific adenine glycosylase